MSFPMRKIDYIEFHRAKVFCKDGSVYIGTGDCVCDASEGGGQELEGVLFLTEDGDSLIITDDEIDRYEILDETA